jgi:hypothetical protein
LGLWAFALALFLLPAVAMQLTDQVVWGLGDFLVFGIMISAVLGGLEIVAALRLQTRYKSMLALAVLAAFFLVWVELAVGIFD